ncbi:hypothetical protein 65p296 [Aeromonas phage 65]|uniref:Uncharacterized protein n=1 Tax=Aeromonas phage 65 TaxID=2919549 RepID=E5DSD0_9CAUD|nr:hypothetical protein ST65p296 [Aeromonas phage 65]ADQ53304.1 hypothetical protein 65p296 [Aeromonas phage 65]
MNIGLFLYGFGVGILAESVHDMKTKMGIYIILILSIILSYFYLPK